MTNKKFLSALKKHRDQLAKDRDSLRDLLNEVESLDDVTSRAIDDLENAICTLSEQV